MMSDTVPTFVRENGEVLAFFEGRVIARGPSFAKVEQTALDYLDNLNKDRGSKEAEKSRKAATHIKMPNGEKAQILSRVDGMWGEKEITIRTEKGRIVKLAAHGEGEEQIEYVKETTQASNPIEALQLELDAEYDRDRPSLVNRIASLDEIILSATNYLRKGASYLDEAKLDKISLHAEHEKQEIGEALAYLKQADEEALVPSAPEFTAVEQADMGRAHEDSWLDHTVQQMIDESEKVNYDKLLAEEPALFAADLETGTLADQGATAEIALSHITAKTAAFEGREVESYREKFVAATELARRSELAARKESMFRQAATVQEESQDFPDEGLFL